jgi:hypothetical protein
VLDFPVQPDEVNCPGLPERPIRRGANKGFASTLQISKRIRMPTSLRQHTANAQL